MRVIACASCILDSCSDSMLGEDRHGALARITALRDVRAEPRSDG
jgi:hypothetical protein